MSEYFPQKSAKMAKKLVKIKEQRHKNWQKRYNGKAKPVSEPLPIPERKFTKAWVNSIDDYANNNHSTITRAKNKKPLKQSRGEKEISQWLSKHKIKFVPEKEFGNCRNPNTNSLLRFDFWLPKNKMIIEFDGIQHFFEVANFDDSLECIQLRDKIKDQYCIDRKIKMIRIKYTQFGSIQRILTEHLL